MKINVKVTLEDEDGNVETHDYRVHPKEFSSGREGFYSNRRLGVGDKVVRMQIHGWENSR